MKLERELYLGIDCSGARGPALPGLCVARATQGARAPELVAAPDGAQHWSRGALRAFLGAIASGKARAVAGFDASFGAAWWDERSYFPGLADAPRDAPSLWAAVEAHCTDDLDGYAGAIYLDAHHAWSPWLLTPRGRGARWRHRTRVTDRAAAAVAAGATPSSTFHFVGPAAVGAASFSLWRLLHALRAELGSRLAIWPMDPPERCERATLLLVEVFPRLAWLRSGADPRAWSDAAQRARATHYGITARAARAFAPRSEHEADAWIACAALRADLDHPELWDLSAHPPEVARCEGWILGAPPTAQ
ncbi:MAG: hypothetical protein IPN34_00520 [Planctomycetes bacterium]|nr:hypothetical protein [Planctomycetota bacterium]